VAGGETDVYAMGIDASGAGAILTHYYGGPEVCEAVASWGSSGELHRPVRLPWCAQGLQPFPGPGAYAYAARALSVAVDRVTHAILLGGEYRDGADLGAGPVRSRGGAEGFVEVVGP
jgi:hypothetical protein